jgi:hypothetical protein
MRRPDGAGTMPIAWLLIASSANAGKEHWGVGRPSDPRPRTSKSPSPPRRLALDLSICSRRDQDRQHPRAQLFGVLQRHS